MKKPIITLCALIALPLAAVANNILPESNRIDAVTVFLDRAEVTRLVDVSLRKGAHSIEVSGLPAQLIAESIKASAEGPKGLRIGSVETRRVFGTKAAAEQERKLREQLQLVVDKQAQLEGQLQALNTQAAFIERLATLPADDSKEGERRLEPEKWPTAWQAIGTGMAETNTARIKLKHENRELQQQIRKLKQQLQQIETGRRDSLSVVLHIEASTAGQAQFTLGYQLPNATWTPGYDARLTTEARKLALTQTAQVQQSSGENWSDVSLTVSTARPSAGAVMPELHPWWIDFAQRVAKRMNMYDEESFAAAPMAEPQLGKQKAEAKMIMATTEASEFNVRYRIPGRVSVPADNSQQRFVLAEQQFTTTLAARTTPRQDPRAFLYAELKYKGETPLLAGEWQLQRDGVYVGKAYQEAIRPGEELALAFGSDDAIKVEHKLLKDERSKTGLLNRDTRVERHYLISVSNAHKQSIPVSVYDQIPVASNEAIEVELDPNGTKPTEQDVDDNSGVLKWLRELKPGGKLSINFGYSVSFPQDKEVPGF